MFFGSMPMMYYDCLMPKREQVSGDSKHKAASLSIPHSKCAVCLVQHTAAESLARLPESRADAADAAGVLISWWCDAPGRHPSANAHRLTHVEAVEVGWLQRARLGR